MPAARDSWLDLNEACGIQFEALRKRWDLTTEADETERKQIMEELRRVTRVWNAALEAHHGE